ncbi:MAG TPA: AAA family ATPase [Xanthobacteraceae bacterium]|jgi:predicted ATPase|nr:AAA family ATPase [Xanthobacteraceae bacterium]
MIEAPFLRNIRLRDVPSDNAYPLNIALARNGFDLELDRPVTILCGENGTGKSTLIEAIAINCGFSITGGNRNHNIEKQVSDVEPLLRFMKFSWALKVNDGFFMRAESFFQFSNQIDSLARETGRGIYRAYGGKSLHAQSHGEAFLSLFTNRIGRKGVYLFDEPEAALSPNRQLALLGLIHDLEKTHNAQFIMVTHSPILMAYPGATLFCIDDGKILEKNFKATPHYQMMARFFSNPDKYLENFFAD